MGVLKVNILYTILCSLIFCVQQPVNLEVKDYAETIFSKAYPSLALLSYSKGKFTGSNKNEYIAYYEDPKHRYDNTMLPKIDKVVIISLNGNVVQINRDLSDIDVSSLGYTERYLKIIINPLLAFGKWNGYSYISDFNGNGIDEVLFFQLAGTYFLPMIIEYDGKTFNNVITFETYYQVLTEIRSEIRGGRKLLKLYGGGTPGFEKGKRDWYLYEWDAKRLRYEIIEKGFE